MNINAPSPLLVEELAAEMTARAKEKLAAHAKRPIRAFLADRNVRGTDVETAFWDLVYPWAFRATHDQALAVALEFESSPRPVQEVIDGYRPECLTRRSSS